MEGVAGLESFWRRKRVFVTGCTGLLGSWLTRRLVGLGAEVTGLVRDLVPGSNLRWSGVWECINVVRGQVEDYFSLERALNEYEIEVVFHLAAQTIVGIANRNPLSTFETNIKGTWCLLEACRHSPWVQQIVIASSDKAYGAQPSLPYDESTPLQGVNPYDVSKSCADLLAGCYAQTFDLPLCITRCGNVYGGGDLNFNRIVPGTIRSVLLGEHPIIRSDGTYVRDYFYVEDAAEAYLLLAYSMATKGLRGGVFNFSNEEPLTVLEIVQRILTLMSRTDLTPVIRNEATHEIREQYLSAAKARQVLGWQPIYPLDTGLQRTVAWYQDCFE